MSIEGWEQVEQVTVGRASGRFVAGSSGNPAGRPPRRVEATPLDAALAALGGVMPQDHATMIARVVAGLPVAPPAPTRPGETGWARLLRLLPDSGLDALEAMPQAEREALALSLGAVPPPCE